MFFASLIELFFLLLPVHVSGVLGALWNILYGYNQSNACDIAKRPPEVGMHSVFLDRLVSHDINWNLVMASLGILVFTVKLLCNTNCKCHITLRFPYDVCSANMWGYSERGCACFASRFSSMQCQYVSLDASEVPCVAALLNLNFALLTSF
jgi:hypothetical protein